MTEVVMKAVALVETAETDNPNGAFDVILSAPTLDRDGEVIDSRAFDPLPDHIPFDVDHTMTVTGTVGSGTPYYDEGGNLRVKGTFASTALGQEVRTLVSEGHIRTTSVTFMAAKRVKDDKGIDHIQTAELLNGTFTPVPSNRESVVLSAKALNAAVDEKVGARNSATDLEKIQAAHDAMTALGAACAVKTAVPDGAKSIVGSLEATRDRVADALDDAYPQRWTYIRGVLPTEVVFEAGDMTGGASATYRQSYTDDGTVATLTGDPVEVDVQEIVVQDADADRETDDVLKSTDTATTEATAPAAADVAAKSADGDDLRARLALTENAARFAFS